MNKLKPLSFKSARDFVQLHHRHSKPPVGHKFSIGLINDEGSLIGVVIVGRPVARGLDDGFCAEVTRCCTDGSKNACSQLYGAARRAARAMGYIKIITYTRADEGGGSLRGAGWSIDGQVRGRSWSTPSRPRAENEIIDKIRWVSKLN